MLSHVITDLFTIHVEILTIDLNAHDDDLIIPLPTNGSIPQVSHIQRRICATNDLWEKHVNMKVNSLGENPTPSHSVEVK